MNRTPQPRITSAPDQPTLRPCDINREIFDADFLDVSVYESAITSGQDASRELTFINDAVEDTIKAISACETCPGRERCRLLTLKRIDENIGPAGVVQAGIYWGTDQQPDFTLNGCVDESTSSAVKDRSGHGTTAGHRVDAAGRRWPLTVPIYSRYPSSHEQSDQQGPVATDLGTWDVSWVPTQKNQVNMLAVSLVVDDEDAANRVVVQAKLLKCPDLDADGKEILTDSDVCEALRIMSSRRVSIRIMAERLGISYVTCKSVLRRLGLPVFDSIRHQEAALLREARKRKSIQENHIAAQMSHFRNRTEMYWDATTAGEQLDLCAAAFDEELSKDEQYAVGA